MNSNNVGKSEKGCVGEMECKSTEPETENMSLPNPSLCVKVTINMLCDFNASEKTHPKKNKTKSNTNTHKKHKKSKKGSNLRHYYHCL